jgi:hypothetical protein
MQVDRQGFRLRLGSPPPSFLFDNGECNFNAAHVIAGG